MIGVLQTRLNRFRLPVAVIMLIFAGVRLSASAAPAVGVSVKTILAEHGPKYEDPKIRGFINEVKPVFRYSSYRLIGQGRVQKPPGMTGSVSLPGGRALMITPVRIVKNRVELKLEIRRGKQAIFSTVARLQNGRAITVGGPKHGKGHLLFNISARF
jgi:hypothetical protein